MKLFDNIKPQTINFPVCPVNKNSPEDKFSNHMNKNKTDKYIEKKVNS